MARPHQPELLFLHALPLDGSMWAEQMDLLPGHTHAPTLYGFGDTVEEWAAAVLKLVDGDELIVVGCSACGSCAIEVAVTAPDRVAALVLIGTKADLRPSPTCIRPHSRCFGSTASRKPGGRTGALVLAVS